MSRQAKARPSQGARHGAGLACLLALGCNPLPGPLPAPESADAEGVLALPQGFDDAREVVVGDPMGVVKSIDYAAQHNFFRFQGLAGRFYEIRTGRGDYNPDTTLTLYDASGSQLAFNDEGFLWLFDDIDARIVIRLPADGAYYVKVEDIDTPEAYFDTWRGGLFYRLQVRELTAATQAVAFEYGSHGLDVATDVQLERLDGHSHRQATLLGEFEEALDMDLFRFSGIGDSVLLARVHRAGVDGNGSTARDRLIWLTDSARATLAEISPAAGQLKLSPPVGADDYTLWVASEGDRVGDNDFYALDLVMVPDNPVEHDDARNGSVAFAEPLTVDVGGYRSHGYVLAHLPENDVDYFAFEARAGERVSATCSGSSEGSGLVSLRAELRDPDDRMLAAELETSTEALEIGESTLERSGTHYLRLSSGLQRWGLEGDWARCVLTLTHF